MGNEKILIWGTGANAKKINKLYYNELLEENIVGYVDNDSKKWGELFFGKKIFSPSEIDNFGDITIIISVKKSKDIIDQINMKPWKNSVKILDDTYFLKKRVIKRYKESDDAEIQDILSYLNDHALSVFNYSWVDMFMKKRIVLYHEDGLYYVIHNGKKLFFSKKYNTEELAEEYYKSLLIEQYEKSPHRYITKNYGIEEGDIVVDAGAAEGIFSLDIIEKARYIYLFEPDESWIEALEHTFFEFRDKIIMIPKCVSNYTDQNTTTIDDSLGQTSIDFLKMDIEGEEYYALCGAKRVLEQSKDAKCVVCTYHQEFAYYAIENILKRYGYDTTHSEGYMWYVEHFNNMRPPVLRRGLIRARKR